MTAAGAGARARAIALAGLALLAGCTTRPGAPPPPEATRVGPALVVVGVAAERGTGAPAPGVRPPATLTATWRRYDPATLRLAPGPPAIVVELRCAVAAADGSAGRAEGCAGFRPVHHVATLEAGHYALAGVVLGGTPARVTRYFLADTLAGSETPRFAVGAGETVYVGDHVFGWAERPTPLLRLHWNDAAARAALAARGEREAPLRRPPRTR